MLLLMSVGSISESFEQGTPVPFFKNFGGMLLNYDQQLYENSLDIQEQGGVYLADEKFMSKIGALWEGLKYFGNILYGWWIFYVLILLLKRFSELLITNNTSAVAGNIIVAIIIIACIQIVGSFVILDPGIDSYQELDITQKVIPFRGMYESIKTVPLVFNPVYNKVNAYENDLIDNETISDIKDTVMGELLNENSSTKNISGAI